MTHGELSASELLKEIKKDLQDFGGKVNLYKGPYCGGDSKCSGLFYLDSRDNPIIKIAKGGPENEWIGILVHEYCHFLQWKDDIKVWKKFSDNCATFDDLMLNPKKYKNEIIDLIALELDCEKKAVRILKANQLLDIEDYIKSANAILLKYAYLYHYNKWPNKFFKFQKVKKGCPDKLLKSASEYINTDKELLNCYT